MTKVLLDQVSHQCSNADHDDDIIGYVEPGLVIWEVRQIRTDREGLNQTKNAIHEISYCPHCGDKLPVLPELLEVMLDTEP